MTRIFDVAVIGGGMVGAAAAWHCRARGLSTALIDPGDLRAAASFGNAGVISRGSLLPVTGPGLWRKLVDYALNRDPGVRLDHRALWRLAPWIAGMLKGANEAHVRHVARALNPLCAEAYTAHADVAAEIGVAHLLAQRGWLKLYRTEEAFAGAAFERALLAEHGVATEVFDGHELRQLEPALRRTYARAMLVTDTGAVSDPGALVAAWTEAAVARGVVRVSGTATALRPEVEHAVIELQGASVTARTVIVAAGAASADLVRPLGFRIPFAAERGYHRHFVPAGEHVLQRPVYDTGGAVVLAPMAAGVRVSSGVELTDRHAPPHYGQIEAAEAEARSIVALGAAVDDTAWVGSRPSTPDGLPVIGRPKRSPRLVFAFGHGHIGLSLGPVTGRLVADLVTGATPHIDLAPFAVERFTG